jgi:hypothetical protein
VHCPEPVPTGTNQRRHFPPLGDGFGGIAPMFQGIVIARLTTAPLSAAMHSAPRLPADRRLPARRPASGPGTAPQALVHG